MSEQVKKLNVIKKCIFNLTCSSQIIKENDTIIAKGDSRASSDYIQPEDATALLNFKMEKGLLVQQPDNRNLRATGSGALPLPDKLSQHAKEAHVLHLKSASLIALEKLCNNNCTVVLSKH